MTLTILSAAKEVTALADVDMKNLAKAISSGSLRGARGNSGVILSQLLRGFTKSIRDEKEIDTAALAAACQRARDTAYKAVMKPKEGTILTVASGIADKAAELALETEDLEEFIPAVIEHADEVLQKTPEMLPVLKEAGVVDSGGQGLLEVIRGAYDAFLGKEIDYSAIAPAAGNSTAVKVSVEEEKEIKFGYCTEFIILLDKATGKIIEAIKHVGFSQNSYRTILPGSTYVAPPKTDAVNPFTIKDEALFAFLHRPTALFIPVSAGQS